jgi:hypothetical protein
MVETDVEVPAAVQDAADAYVKSKRLVAKHREAMNGNLDRLVEEMKEAEITEVYVDDREKRIILSEKDAVKIVKTKKANDGAEDEDEE